MPQQDDFKSLSSRELVSKRGADLIIINPGSDTLTLGLGSSESPVHVPHAVAYATSDSKAAEEFGEDDSEDVSGDRSHAREVAYLEASTSVRIQPQGQQWHAPCVVRNEIQGRLHPQMGNVLVGEQTESLKSSDPYRVWHPMVSGRLNPKRTRVEATRDLAHIWGRVVEERLGISNKRFADFSVVLVVSEDLSGVEVEILADVILRELGFKDVVVHVEAIAATFGQGCSGACVVNLGSHTTTLCCVEDGIITPSSRVLLPYGGVCIGDSLLWLLRRQRSWSQQDFDPTTRPCDASELNRMVLRSCFLPAEGAERDVQRQIASCPNAVLNIVSDDNVVSELQLCLGPAACVAPMGYFHPDLFYSESERSRPPSLKTLSPLEAHWRELSAHPLHLAGDDDFHDDIYTDPVDETHSLADHHGALGLDDAIVKSISSIPRPHQRKRLYSSILLVGEYAGLRGLPDMLERRVLAALPQDEITETVAVMEPKSDVREAIWKGGVLLGILEGGDHWVKKSDWLSGGVRVGDPVKYVKSELVLSKLFWYFRAQQGTV
ncbi:hypothetical protein BSKO_07527 [Bryopsis sp. KO-2023]|nr:hypothetical protein BSKO_07527 [Bryopsis sp. KO-2023]